MPPKDSIEITSIESLRQLVELSEVFLAEEHAARKGKSSIELDGVENNPDKPTQIKFNIKVAPSRLIFRLKVTHDSLAARVVVEHEASYSSKQTLDVPQHIAEEFGVDVLVNTLFPLARNTIYASWARLGVRSKNLSLVKRSDIVSS